MQTTTDTDRAREIQRRLSALSDEDRVRLDAMAQRVRRVRGVGQQMATEIVWAVLCWLERQER